MPIGSDVLSLVGELDRMYEAAVRAPKDQHPASLAAWGETLLAERRETALAAREVPRSVRRAVRVAVKLRDHWEERLAGGLPASEDWRSCVDQAMGGRAWKPGLDLCAWALEADPSPELFEEVSQRFRWVHLQPWMEGVGYREWLAAKE